MITDYQVLCSRASKRLGLEEEEVIRQVETYAKILIEEIRRYESPYFDFFGIATMRLLPYKLEGLMKTKYFELRDKTPEELELLLKKARWLEDNDKKIDTGIGKFVENGLPIPQEELDRREKEILELCKEPKRLKAVRTLGYKRPFTREFLLKLVADGKLELKGRAMASTYTTI